MFSSLSEKVNIQVNDYPIILGRELNEGELKNHKINKINFFHRLIYKFNKSGQKGELIYCAKNSHLKYIKGKFGKDLIFPIWFKEETLFAKLNMFLNELEPVTLAFLIFKDKRLIKFRFQVNNKKMKSHKILKNLEMELIKLIGKPKIDGLSKAWGGDWNQGISIQYPSKENDFGIISMLLGG